MRSLRPSFRFLILLWLFTASAAAQSVAQEGPQVLVARPAAIEIPLVVPAGTPLRVALPERVRIRDVGEPVRATVTHPVYAFDQEVIPAGSELTGRVARIDPISKKRRILGIANADFTPTRRYDIDFDSLVLPDGRRIAIRTEVSPGAAEVVRLVSDPAKEKKRNAVAQAAADAKKQVSDTVHGAITTIKSPGRFARFKRYLAGLLPFRRQFAERGTRFNAALEAPLDFGAVTRTSEELAALGSAPAEDSFLEARLAAAVSSATAQQGTPVEAIVTAPLFSPEQKLVFPANSRLIGEVVEVKPARKLHRNGKMRFVFRRIELPDGVAQRVSASLAGMEVDRRASLQLDAEGGATATESKMRYLSTGLALVVAVRTSQPDDVDPGETVGDPGTHTAAGSSGLRLVGATMSLAVQSPIFSRVLGIYGAGFSVYRNFLSRGRDVNLPANTPMEISFGKPRPAAEKEP